MVRSEPDLIEPEKARGRGRAEKAETAGKVEPGTQAQPKRGRASASGASVVTPGRSMIAWLRRLAEKLKRWCTVMACPAKASRVIERLLFPA